MTKPLYTSEHVHSLKSAIAEAPPAATPLFLYAVIETLVNDIGDMLGKGYTFPAISEFLNQRNILITPGTLRAYYYRARRLSTQVRK